MLQSDAWNEYVFYFPFINFVLRLSFSVMTVLVCHKGRWSCTSSESIFYWTLPFLAAPPISLHRLHPNNSWCDLLRCVYNTIFAQGLLMLKLTSILVSTAPASEDLVPEDSWVALLGENTDLSSSSSSSSIDNYHLIIIALWLVIHQGQTI